MFKWNKVEYVLPDFSCETYLVSVHEYNSIKNQLTTTTAFYNSDGQWFVDSSMRTKSYNPIYWASLPKSPIIELED